MAKRSSKIITGNSPTYIALIGHAIGLTGAGSSWYVGAFSTVGSDGSSDILEGVPKYFPLLL